MARARLVAGLLAAMLSGGTAAQQGQDSDDPTTARYPSYEPYQLGRPAGAPYQDPRTRRRPPPSPAYGLAPPYPPGPPAMRYRREGPEGRYRPWADFRDRDRARPRAGDGGRPGRSGGDASAPTDAPRPGGAPSESLPEGSYSAAGQREFGTWHVRPSDRSGAYPGYGYGLRHRGPEHGGGTGDYGLTGPYSGGPSYPRSYDRAPGSLPAYGGGLGGREGYGRNPDVTAPYGGGPGETYGGPGRGPVYSPGYGATDSY